ncbi:MAG: cobalt ECF transporter T component CbiQ [Scytolyngbya sp. HA4215-MV1]|nr:cobalt ECF transporter T component CbiQ [Scytolyngbya sp. HA4215-MV1]
MILHVGAFHLDVDSQKTSVWRNLAPQTRILCVVLLVFAIALTPNGRWLSWIAYTIGVALLVLLSRVTLLTLLKRIAVELGFVSTVLLGTLFRQGGTVLWHWGWLSITTTGLMVLGSVVWKALLSLLILNTLVMTTPIPHLLQALITLKTPPLLVAILASMYRYISVLVDEAGAMQRAAASRNLLANPRWQRLVVGNTIGALFIRTLDRGERVHQAMLSRGFTGIVPLTEKPKYSRSDRLVLVLTCLLVLLGQGIYLL